MLLGSFFSIVSTTPVGDTGYNCELKLNPDHRIYKGHFPGKPVLPGVCQIGMVREVAEQCTGLKMRIRSADQIKFLKLIDPAMLSRLELELQFRFSGTEETGLTATIRQGQDICLKFKGTLCTR